MVRRKLKTKDIIIGVAALVVILILMFYIWHQAECVRLGYRTQELEQELQHLREEIAILETQKARLLAPDRVARIAQEELGYTQIQDDQFVSGERDKAPRKKTP